MLDDAGVRLRTGRESIDGGSGVWAIADRFARRLLNESDGEDAMVDEFPFCLREAVNGVGLKVSSARAPRPSSSQPSTDHHVHLISLEAFSFHNLSAGSGRKKCIASL